MPLPGSIQCHCTSGPRPRFSAAFGVFAVLALSLIATSLAPAAPEPDPVPRRWELQMVPGPMRVITIDIPNVGPRMFAYMTYGVVNNSGEDLLFAPSFELANGEGQVLRSGRDIPQLATSELLKLTQNPFMQDQIAIIGDLLQGEENGKDGLVIWPVTDTNPTKITVYAAGFSGETKTVDVPGSKDKIVFRKTLALEYEAPGDLTNWGAKPLKLTAKRWIMR